MPVTDQVRKGQRKSMRVLHVNPRYYPYIGGSEIYCQEVSERLARDGHTVTVFTTDAWDLEYFWHPARKHLTTGKEPHNGVEVERFAVKHLLSNRFSYGALRYLMRILASLPVDARPVLFRLCPYLPWVPDLSQRLSRGPASYDIVHVMNITFDSMVYAAYRFARRCGIPWVITPFVHLGEPDDAEVRQYYTMPHQIAMMRNSDRVITQTDLEGDYLRSHGIPADRICKIGVGITPQDLLGGWGNRFREKYRLHMPLVFYIGMQAYDKGTIHLIQAMAQLWEQGNEADLVLAGPAMSEVQNHLLALPQAIRERCHFLGFISEEDKRDLLDAGDVFVMPSRTDSFGIVYLEAWLYRKPVVGALAGGVPEVIRDNEEGYLVPFGNVPRLREAIGMLLADPDKARRFGEKGYQKAIAHTWDSKYAAIKAVYEGLTSQEHRSGVDCQAQ